MKLSAAAVLISLSSASAFSVSYLNQLSSGASAPSGGGITSYLDGISGATATESVPALVTALEQAAPAPAAAVATPAAAGDYLSALNGNAAPSGAGLTSHLDTLATSNTQTSGAGLTGYLDALPSSATQTTGTGFTTHLDTLGSAAPVAAAPVAAAPVAPAAPAPVAAAPAPVAAAPVAASAPNTGSYLDTLNSGAAPTTGAGFTGHLDTLATSNTQTSGAGLTTHLDTLGTAATQTSGAGLTGYLDALKTNEAIAASPAGGSQLTSFLESVYSQIMALPEDGSKKVSGGTVAFAKAEGPYAISFVKK